jgi:amino-acid N-acetyltransferase
MPHASSSHTLSIMTALSPRSESRTYSLRAATAADFTAVLSLLTTAKLALDDVDAQFGPQFAVAVDDTHGAVIGAAGVERYGDADDTVGLFRSAVVHDDWRGLGVGAALTADRIAWAEAEQLRALYLLTQTAADYWPRFGFERTARDTAPAPLMASHEWRHGCPSSAVAMRLDLPRRA